MTKNRISQRLPNDLLTTKMEVPMLASHIVERERLTKKLTDGMEGLVTLIVAPAGYGKTTLLVEFLSSFLSTGWRSAWVSLDTHDNHRSQFWSYILASIQKVHQNFCVDRKQLLQEDEYSDADFFLNPIINEIAQIPYNICLILDDYQVISNEQIHHSVNYFVDHQPKNIRLIISSRKTPPFPFSRLRAQRLLHELSINDLSFNFNETTSFLSGVMNLDMFDDQIEALQEVTEGWIAGLQLAALSLQGKFDFHRLVIDLQGGTPHIFDYLTEEVLNQQDPEIKEFLLKTSILSEFSPSLCNAIVNRGDSQEYLDRIERSKLFITSLDDKQNWYRYHHLFGETLRSHLEKEYKSVIPALYQKACDWSLENGFPDQAVTYALAGSDVEKAARIIDTCAMQAVIQFDLVKLVQYVSRFSDEMLAKRPQLGIYYALANLHLGRIDRIEPKLQNLENILDQSNSNGQDRDLIRWEIEATRASVDCFYNDIARGIPKAIELKQNTPKEDVFFYGQISHCLAEAYAAQGELDLAVKEYSEGIEFAEEHQLTIEYAYSLHELAYVKKLQGQLQESERLYRNLLDYIVQSGLCDDTIIFAQCGLAEIAIEKNDLSSADRWMQAVIQRFDKIKVHRTTWFQHEWLSLGLVRYFIIRNEFELAQHYFQEALDGFRENPYVLHYLYSILIRTQVRFITSIDALPIDNDAINRNLKFAETHRLCQFTQLISDARYLLHMNDLDDSFKILDTITDTFDELGINEYLLECIILKALIAWKKKQKEDSHQYIYQALEIAMIEGYMRIFLDEGNELKDILLSFDQDFQLDGMDQRKNAIRKFCRQIISNFNIDRAFIPFNEAPPSLKKLPDSPLTEPLSERELEVLRMRMRGKSNKEIAVALTISHNTVKTHIKNIYRKLDVHHIHDLYHRVEDLGLLEREPDNFGE